MTEIWKHSRRLYKQVQKMLTFLRRQNYHYGIRMILKVLEEYQQLLPMYISDLDLMEKTGVGAEHLLEVLQNLMTAQQNKDYILLADLYEMQVIPFLRQLAAVSVGEEPEWGFGRFTENFAWLQEENPSLAQELFGDDDMETGWHRRREEILAKGFVPEYSQDGSVIMSAEDAQGRFYFHTNVDAVQEAEALAGSWFSGGKFDYVLYGLGLGYHIEALQDMQNHIRIHIYEGNMDVIFMALCFSNMHCWDKSRIQVHIDRNLQRFSREIKEMNPERTEVIIHYPSVRALQEETLQSLLRDYFAQYTSAKAEAPLLRGNFFCNEEHRAPSVWELQKEFAGRDVYVVAAGPSLDKNVECLRNVPEEARILTTGTVLKKLLNLGIRPHYVIIIDGGEGTYGQVEGICDCGVPLLYMATVNNRIVEEYSAPKYVIYQQGFDLSERAAAAHGVQTFQTGGSVSTTALDLCLQFAAGRIIWLGLDLAYTGGVSHCDNTADEHIVDDAEILMVDATGGGKVACGRNLNAYRKWMERRLAQGCGSTEVINATEGGAYIRGMRNEKLKDICG